jgi:hypothetical protein
MPGDLFFMLTRDHTILGQFDDLLSARDALHATPAGQYVARLDGIVLAYMSREGQSWKAISKVPPEVRKLFEAYGSNPPIRGRTVYAAMIDDAQDFIALYPPPAEDHEEAASEP